MTGIALTGLDVAAVELQLVSDTGMTMTVEDNGRKIILHDQILHCLANPASLGWHAHRTRDDQVIVHILAA